MSESGLVNQQVKLSKLQALTLLVGQQEGHLACKKYGEDGGGGHWLVRMVGVSASVNIPLHHKVQKFSSGTGSPGWSWKKGRKTAVVWCGWALQRASSLSKIE